MITRTRSDDSGIEEVVIEAAPLVTNVEKNKRGQAKNSKWRMSGITYEQARTGPPPRPHEPFYRSLGKMGNRSI